jgi:membrane protease YdiL (CAAX protease family)
LLVVIAAAAEVLIVFTGILVFIWRLQFVFPDFAWFLLAFIILTFFIHRDSLRDLGLGSHGLVPGMKAILAPTLIISLVLVLTGVMAGTFTAGISHWRQLSGLGRYFAWCLFQEFGLQSFFTNRILQVLKDPKKTAWVSATIFAAFHIPNPVLIPVTFAGGVILARIFMKYRNLVPLAAAQAIIGALTSVAIPAAWHHGLRVGPGYYQ